MKSVTKVGLKLVCNVVFVIFGRSKAKDRNDGNCVTLKLQTFGARYEECDKKRLEAGVKCMLNKKWLGRLFCPNHLIILFLNARRLLIQHHL